MNYKLIKHKICTMNCGPAIGDTRTQSERQNACGDCIIEVDAQVERVALSDDRIDEIMAMVQEFASTWVLVGGRFDDGSMLDAADAQKTAIRAILAAQADVSDINVGDINVGDINVGDMPENVAGIGIAHKPYFYEVNLIMGNSTELESEITRPDARQLTDEFCENSCVSLYETEDCYTHAAVEYVLSNLPAPANHLAIVQAALDDAVDSINAKRIMAEPNNQVGLKWAIDIIRVIDQQSIIDAVRNK